MPQTLTQYLADRTRARTKVAHDLRRTRAVIRELLDAVSPEHRATLHHTAGNDGVRRVLAAIRHPRRLRRWADVIAHLRRREREAWAMVRSLSLRDTRDLPCGAQDGHLMNIEGWTEEAQQYAALRGEAWRALNAGQPFPL